MKSMNSINDKVLIVGIDHAKQKDACDYFRHKPMMFTCKVAFGTHDYNSEVKEAAEKIKQEHPEIDFSNIDYTKPGPVDEESVTERYKFDLLDDFTDPDHPVLYKGCTIENVSVEDMSDGRERHITCEINKVNNYGRNY